MELSRATFEELRRLIHRLSGIVISDDKEYLIRHRLEPLVRSSDCRSFDEFEKKLAGGADNALQEAVIEAITTQETSFFRDTHPFEALRRHVLPELVQAARTTNTGAGRPQLRLWCCGAATGQEPYSLGILVSEYLAAHPGCGIVPRDVSILATDISAKALATAAAGRYGPRDIGRGLSPGQVHRFFEQQADSRVVRPALRQMFEFRRLNLVRSLSGLGTFDLILCRNVLIYFDETTRREICERFFKALADGGWLVLGSAENLYGISTSFRSVRFGDTLLFRKPSKEH